jgi:hypothetical protein
MIYCDKADYSGNERCANQCDACSDIPLDEIDIAVICGSLQQTSKPLKAIRYNLKDIAKALKELLPKNSTNQKTI